MRFLLFQNCLRILDWFSSSDRDCGNHAYKTGYVRVLSDAREVDLDPTQDAIFELGQKEALCEAFNLQPIHFVECVHCDTWSEGGFDYVLCELASDRAIDNFARVSKVVLCYDTRYFGPERTRARDRNVARLPPLRFARPP